MSSKLQLDVCYHYHWWRRLVNAYEAKAGMIKLCDPYLSALSVLQQRRYINPNYLYLYHYV